MLVLKRAYRHAPEAPVLTCSRNRPRRGGAPQRGRAGMGEERGAEQVALIRCRGGQTVQLEGRGVLFLLERYNDAQASHKAEGMSCI